MGSLKLQQKQFKGPNNQMDKEASRKSKSNTMGKSTTENQSPNGFSHHQEHKQANSQRQ